MTTFVPRSKILLKTKDPKGEIQFKGVTEPEMIQEKPRTRFIQQSMKTQQDLLEKTLNNPIR